MQILDKKGRFFGKVNIIDATILLLLVTILVAWAGLIKKTSSIDHAYKRQIVIVELEARDVPVQLYGLIKKGDKSVGNDLGYHGVIEKSEKTEIRKRNFGSKAKGYVDVRLYLRLMVYIEKGIVLYNNTKLKPGVTATFSTPKYAISGKVITIEKKEALCE